MATKKKGLKPADLSYIAEQLQPLAVPVAELVSDPANARKHGKKNLDAIKASLRVYGQRKPVIVNKRTGHVEAGNGTLEAAKDLQWSHLAAVYVDDDPTTAAGFSISDNRSAELAEWDKDALDALLRTVQTDDMELAKMLAELAELEKIVPTKDNQPAPDQTGQLQDRYQVLVTCADESGQANLLERLTKEGYKCRSLIS